MVDGTPTGRSGADGGPSLGNPLLHPAERVEHLLVAELQVQDAPCDAATPSTPADERNGFVRSSDCRKPRRLPTDVVAASRVGERHEVGTFDDAGVAPLLGSAKVDDGHARFS